MTSLDLDTIKNIEARRLEIQNQLDALKAPIDRNKLGQFATPALLAIDILGYAKTLLSPSEQVRFLDPAFGTGSFFAALLQTFPPSKIAKACAYEVDCQYGQEAARLWQNTPLILEIADFTKASPPISNINKANLLICNPPYVRHHHLTPAEKSWLKMVALNVTGLKLNGLAGLYCYFLLVSHAWLSDRGIAGWLIPSEFMDVRYGRQVKQYLLEQVTLLRLHRFNPNDLQFGDALVSSVILWFRKEKPSNDHKIEFSYGGTLAKPESTEYVSANTLRHIPKWTTLPTQSGEFLKIGIKSQKSILTLSDLFTIKRGLATGANKFFILTSEQIQLYQLPKEFLMPILPGPRYLSEDEIKANSVGNPVLDQKLFLLTCSLPEDKVMTQYPSLWEYLQLGIKQGIDQRYLCKHRSPWYAQENRPAAPLLCTYMGRKSTKNVKPFRFILNHSKATAPNVYLMLYPKSILKQTIKDKPELLRSIWKALKNISASVLIGEGRIYGGGLYKIEPNELANTPVNTILADLPALSNIFAKQLSFFD